MVFLTCAANGADFSDFAQAIHKTETGGRIGAIKGDNGKALGPLQIHKICFLDVAKKGEKYENCADLEFSKEILRRYCAKYAPKDLSNQNWEACARLWNSGPNWKSKFHLTQRYWGKVQIYMKK